MKNLGKERVFLHLYLNIKRREVNVFRKSGVCKCVLQILRVIVNAGDSCGDLEAEYSVSLNPSALK